MKSYFKLKTKLGVIYLPIIIALIGVLFIFVVIFTAVKSSNNLKAFAQTADPIPYGIDLLKNPEKIAYLRPLVKSGQVSSHAKNGLNQDAGHEQNDGQESYLYKTGSNYVLLDEKGPGTITRIRMNYGDVHKNQRLRFYFDGESTPRIDKTLDEIFSGTNPPFLTPLVGNKIVSSGSYYSYVPISFASSVRVEVTAITGYYLIGFEKYDQSMPVTTFNSGINLSTVVQKWQNAGQDPKSLTGKVSTISGSIDNSNPLIAGSSREIFNIPGPAVIKSIIFTIPGYSDPNNLQDRDLYTKVRIKGYWENQSKASIDAPLGAFFGTFPGKTNVKGLFFGSDPSTSKFYNYFPMYFSNSGKLELVSTGSSEFSNISYQIEYIPLSSIDGLGTKIGNFNATYNEEIPVTSGVDYKMVDITGQGQIVATVLAMKCWSPIDGLETFVQCLEGDERFYFDDSDHPAIYGTGTEEYFNGGNYFENGVFSRPTHGHSFEYTKHNTNPQTLDGYYEASNWRVNAGDPLPFRSKIKMGIEHGNPGAFIEYDKKSTWPGNYYSVIFWYGNNSNNLAKIDNLDIGNVQSESAHSYTSNSSTDISSQTFSYEGDNDEILVTDEGETGTGAIQFRMNIQPGKTHILRRRLDQSIRNQTATVRVDGIRIGTWFDGGRNSVIRWKDSEIFVPAAYTVGKSQITIKIEPLAASTPSWTAFRYALYSIPSTSVQQLTDYDSDTFKDSVETAIGTDPNSDCATISKTDAFPPDIDRNGFVTISDILTVANSYGKISSSPDWSTYKRYDMDGNGAINLDDILLTSKFYGKAFCS